MADLSKLNEKFKDLNLLLVEDELKVRELTNSFLKKFFNNILVADDGDSALELLQDNKIDILVTDIDMPKLNGMKLVEEVKKTKPDIFIVYITALREKVDPDTYDLLFLKPLDFESMVHLVEEIDKNFFNKTLKK